MVGVMRVMNEAVTQAVLTLAEAVLASEEHQALIEARADVLADPEMARLWRAVGDACPAGWSILNWPSEQAARLYSAA